MPYGYNKNVILFTTYMVYYRLTVKTVAFIRLMRVNGKTGEL